MYFWPEHWPVQCEVSRACHLEMYNEEADSCLTFSSREAIWWRPPVAWSEPYSLQRRDFLSPISDHSAVPSAFVWCICLRVSLPVCQNRESLPCYGSFLRFSSASFPRPLLLSSSFSLPSSPSTAPPPPFLLILHSFLFPFLFLSPFAIYTEGTRLMFIQCIRIYKEISWTLFCLTPVAIL